MNKTQQTRMEKTMAWTGRKINKIQTENKSRHKFPKRGEMWTVDLGENIGSEANGIVPCLVIQNDKANAFLYNTIVIPMNRMTATETTHVAIGDSDLLSVEKELKGTLLPQQIKTVSKARLGRKVGSLTEEAMTRVSEAMKMMLCLA